VAMDAHAVLKSPEVEDRRQSAFPARTVAAWVRRDDHPDGVRFVRGLLFAVLLSLPFWAIILWIVA
jgi:hypothetical protein